MMRDGWSDGRSSNSGGGGGGIAVLNGRVTVMKSTCYGPREHSGTPQHWRHMQVSSEHPVVRTYY